MTRPHLLLIGLLLSAAAAVAEPADLTAAEWGPMPTASAAVPDMQYRPRFVTDDKPETGWIAPADYQPLWLRLEWRFPVNIDTLSLRQFPEAKYEGLVGVGKFSVEALAGSKWQQIAAGDATGTPADQAVQVRLAAPLHTAAVRFVFAPVSGKTIGVSELSVTGETPVLPMKYAPAWQGAWIWCEPTLLLAHREPTRRYFRRSFTIDDPGKLKQAWLLGTAMDRCSMWVNAHSALQDPSYNIGMLRQAQVKEIPLQWLQQGENVLSAAAEDIYEVGGQGLLAELVLLGTDGTRTIIGTDKQWQAQEDAGVWPDWQKPGLKDNRWVPAVVKSSPNSRWQWLPNVRYPVMAPEETMRVTGLQLQPAALVPGQPAQATVTFEVKQQPRQDYAIILRLGKEAPWREFDYELWGTALAPEAVQTSRWQPGTRTVTLNFEVPAETPLDAPATLLMSLPGQAVALDSDLPQVVASDRFGLQLKLPVARQVGRTVPEAGETISKVPVPAVPVTARDFPDVKLKLLEGNPTLTIDGKPTAPVMWASAYGDYKRYSDYSGSGVRIFRPLMAGTAIAAPGEEEEYYARWFAQIDEAVNSALAVDPEIKLIPAVVMDPNPDALFGAPSEYMVSSRGQMLIPIVMTMPDRAQVRPTFMSESWRRLGAEGLTRLVKHMRSQPYAGHIIGLVFFAGRAGENYWGGNELNLFINEKGQYDAKPREQWDTGDFSMAARRTFREFLLRRYKTDEALQAAWQRPGIRLDDVLEPARFRREEIANVLTWAGKPAGAGTLRDPLAPDVGLLPADYFECFSEAMIDSFIAWGKAVKEASDGRLLTGCYYGYALAHLFTSVPGFAGHTAVDKAARTPYLDLFVSPAEYDENRRAGGHLWGHNITESLRLHNKLFVYEADTRTYLSDIVPKQYSLRESLEVLKRDACSAMLRGEAWWWLEFSDGQRYAQAREWFDDPEILALAGKLKHLYEFSLTLPERGPSAQIAVFYHGNTHTDQDLFPPTLPLNLALGRLTLVNGVQRIGAPYDLYNLADLPDLAKSGKLAQYKLCLMLNPFFLKPEEAKWLELVKGGNRTVVWLYTPGLAQPGKHLQAQNVSDIVGIPGLRLLNEAVEPTCRFTVPSPVTAGLPAGYELAPRVFSPGDIWERFGNAINPLPYLDPQAAGPDTQVLGSWVTNGQVRSDLGAFAIRKQGAWTSVYSAVPYLSVEVMRNLAKLAGVHVYRDSNDILYADRHFVCLHTAANPATDTLRLPRKTPVYDVFAGKTLAQSADELKLDVPPYTTVLYYLGDPGPLQQALK